MDRKKVRAIFREVGILFALVDLVPVKRKLANNDDQYTLREASVTGVGSYLLTNLTEAEHFYKLAAPRLKEKGWTLIRQVDPQTVRFTFRLRENGVIPGTESKATTDLNAALAQVAQDQEQDEITKQRQKRKARSEKKAEHTDKALEAEAAKNEPVATSTSIPAKSAISRSDLSKLLVKCGVGVVDGFQAHKDGTYELTAAFAGSHRFDLSDKAESDSFWKLIEGRFEREGWHVARVKEAYEAGRFVFSVYPLHKPGNVPFDHLGPDPERPDPQGKLAIRKIDLVKLFDKVGIEFKAPDLTAHKDGSFSLTNAKIWNENITIRGDSNQFFEALRERTEKEGWTPWRETSANKAVFRFKMYPFVDATKPDPALQAALEDHQKKTTSRAKKAEAAASGPDPLGTPQASFTADGKLIVRRKKTADQVLAHVGRNDMARKTREAKAALLRDGQKVSEKAADAALNDILGQDIDGATPIAPVPEFMLSALKRIKAEGKVRLLDRQAVELALETVDREAWAWLVANRARFLEALESMHKDLDAALNRPNDGKEGPPVLTAEGADHVRAELMVLWTDGYALNNQQGVAAALATKGWQESAMWVKFATPAQYQVLVDQIVGQPDKPRDDTEIEFLVRYRTGAGRQSIKVKVPTVYSEGRRDEYIRREVQTRVSIAASLGIYFVGLPDSPEAQEQEAAPAPKPPSEISHLDDREIQDKLGKLAIEQAAASLPKSEYAKLTTTERKDAGLAILLANTTAWSRPRIEKIADRAMELTFKR